jgi:RimJ/RimL family protein N-acetyltransferase
VTIQQAKPGDVDAILRIYDSGRERMRTRGNPTQWEAGYPNRAILEEDIRRRQCFVCEETGKIHGVFSLCIGDEPTYAKICEGAWINDAPYGTIHRLAGDGVIPNLFSGCLRFCRSLIPNLRADTHADNHVMRHLLEKNGFQRCGVIYVEDGTPRIAYQLPPR